MIPARILPIDWTKPLRVVGTHEPIESTMIDRHGRRSVVVEHSAPGGASYRVYRVDPATGRTIPPEPVFVVENVPAEPRIVERWMRILRTPSGDYTTDPAKSFFGNVLWDYRPVEFDDHNYRINYRIARVLIEEPE